MALVAYDNSDSSDYEDEEENDSTRVVILKKADGLPAQENKSTELQNGDHELNTCPSLFNRLPAIQKRTVIEEDDEFLHKKETAADCVKPKSKITVPSLSDFEDVKETVPSTKPKFMNGKKSGLLSMLPQPKNSVTASTKSLIPQVLTQKPQSATAKKKTPIPSPSKVTKQAPKPSSSLINDYSDDSDNDDVQNDFFSIHKTVELPPEELPLDIDQSSTSKYGESTSSKQPRSIESYFKQDSVQNVPDGTSHMDTSTVYNEETPQETACASSNDTGEVVLDEEAILKLCGSRVKRKREDIQIVDINQQEVLADAREWLIKGLMDDTSKRASASKRRGNEPTSQQKRKHQITYLAHQAKANEIELQNQWANNRMTKRQTQSKYGF